MGAGAVVVPDEPLPMLPEVLLPVVPEVLLLPLMPDELPDEEGVLLLVPPELEPDLLKCASHSAREIEPLLSVSTAEKLGADVLALALAPVLGELLPEDMLPEAPVDELPEAPDDVLSEAFGVAELLPEAPAEPEAPVVVDGLEPVADGEDDEDWATASVDRANSTAAESALTVFNIWMIPPEG